MPVERFDPLTVTAGAVVEQAMRQRIKNIIRSYHNATDVIAEPIQNSMDEIVRAVEAGTIESGLLEIAINVKADTIEIRDNGRGIPIDDLKRFIAPDVTDKRKLFASGKVRGHKGVGLTFLAYGFNFFEVESWNLDGEHYRVRIHEGRNWVESQEGDPPQAEIERGIEDGRLKGTGTSVLIKVDRHSQPRDLSRTFNSLELTAALLEHETAIGVVPPEDKDHPSVDARLIYVPSSGDKDVVDLATTYRFPHHKNLPHVRALDLDRYIKEHKGEVEPEAKDKRAYHAVYTKMDHEEVASHLGEQGGEVLITKEELQDYLKEHEVWVYALFSYSVEFRNMLTEAWSVPGNRRFHYPGVRIATDGMISSWGRDVSLTRAGGNKDRLWLVYHFQSVEPDMGRKDFPPEVHDVVEVTEERIAQDLIRKSLPFLRPAPKGGTRDGGGKRLKPAVKAYERQKTPMEHTFIEDFGYITYGSSPAEEQDAIAVFNQLVALGVLKQFQPVYFSGIDDYDAYFQYDPDGVPERVAKLLPGDEDLRETEGVAEFKYDGIHLLDDLVNETKRWEDLLFLVCWTISRGKKSVGGDEIQFQPVASPVERKYAGVTHLASLQSAGTRAIHVVCLSDLLEALAEDAAEGMGG